VVQLEKNDSYQGFASAMPQEIIRRRNGFSRWVCFATAAAAKEAAEKLAFRAAAPEGVID
jgi:hypothetical protein